jgi:hypothetical protein
MFDSWQTIVAFVAAILIAYAVILWLGTIVWVHRDIRERTRDTVSQWISDLLVIFLTLPGLILYLVLRPRETLMEAYERRLETEALLGDLPDRRTCPSCQRPSRPDYLVCPFCRTALRQSCGACSKPLELTWVACPYCGAQGPQYMAMPAATPPMPASLPAAQARATPPPEAAPPPAQPRRSTAP